MGFDTFFSAEFVPTFDRGKKFGNGSTPSMDRFHGGHSSRLGLEASMGAEHVFIRSE